MFKELQLSLYEVFGYVLPGFVAFGAISVALWAVVAPNNPIILNARGVQFWIALLAFSYFFGHVAQGIGNLYAKLFKVTEEEAIKSVPEEILSSVKKLLEDELKVPSKNLSPKWIYEVASEVTLQHGNSNEREVFQYREGFYRGLTVSLIMLGFGAIARAIIPGTTVLHGGSHFPLPTTFTAAIAAISFGCAALMHQRYRRFGIRKVTSSILAVLAIRTKLSVEKKSAGASGR